MSLKRFFVVFGTLVVVCASLGVAQAKKYDVKSGVVTFETLTTEGRITVVGKIVLYFDDYGRKECKDTYVGGMLTESVLSDGMNTYTIWHERREYFKRGPSTGGTEIRFDWEGIPDTRKHTLKKLPDVQIANLPCEIYEQTRGATSVKLAGWNHILLYREDIRSGGSWVLKAVEVDSVTVPQFKFVPPPTYEAKSAMF